MSSMNDINDFDEDLDDILLSDDETNKKSKKILSSTKNDMNETVIENGKQMTVILPPSKKNEIKPFKGNIFEDGNDPLAMIDVPKQSSWSSQDLPKQSAKSLLDSLLSPPTELDVFPVNKTDDFWKASSYRPSTSGPKMKETVQSNGSKRTVRFSNEGLVDDDLDTSLPMRGRPVTAPSTTAEVSKTKFVTRFEEAENDGIFQKHSDIKSISESDPSLWGASISDDFLGQSTPGIKLKNEDEEVDRIGKDGNSRLNPKQKLSDFLQTSNEQTSQDYFRVAPKSSHSTMELSEQPSTNNIGESNFGRRFSVQADPIIERPRTGHGRADGGDMNYRRRSSVQAEMLFERPRTGDGRGEHFQTKSDASRNFKSDVDLQLKHMQGERDDLLYKLEGVVKRNKEEMEIVEKSYKNRIELMEENIQRKEKRFKEEIDILSQQNKQKLQMLEDERMEMRTELSRREEDIENQKRQELSRIKEQHKLELDRLKLNHDDLIERLRHAKSEEDSTIRLAQPTTAQLQSVLAQVSSGASDLASLKQQLLDQMNQQIREKDLELKLKNDSLRQLEEELNVQKHENIKERERLQSLISKLDNQLKDQTKQADEDRWHLRQEQNKHSSMQLSLERERENLQLEKDRNRESLEEFRAKLLEEQKHLFDKVYEEKRSLAEERAKITREVAKWSETSQISNVKKNQEFAEFEGIRAAFAEERREIESLRTQMAKEREENAHKASHLNSLSYDLQLKSEKLDKLELDLASTKDAIETKERSCRQLNYSGEESLRKANDIQNSHQDQLNNIHKQLLVLTEKEKQIHREQMELEKHRVSTCNRDKSLVCTKCSNTLRDSALGGSLKNIDKQGILKMSTYGRSNNYDGQGVLESVDYSQMVADKMEEERLIHSIRRAAEEDRDYLDNERAYLKSLSMTKGQYWRNVVQS